MGFTITKLFSDAATQHPDRIAFSWKTGGTWNELSYRDASERIAHIGAGMIALGLERGDRVSILSNSRIEWSLIDYGALGAGAIVAPIYQTSSAPEVEYILNDCQAKILVLEDAEQLAKVQEVRPQLTTLEHIVVLDPTGVDMAGESTFLTLEKLEQLGREGDVDGWTSRRDSVKPGDLATYIYTSGTTGPPKGCMITHDNYAGMAEQVFEAGLGFDEQDVIILFLPLAHNFARLIQFVAARVGGKLAFSTIPTIMDDLGEVRPTVLPSVPRVFEKAHTRISGMFAEATGAKAKLIARAMKVGALRGKYVQHGRRVPPVLAAQYALFHKLVFSKIHARFGGNLRFAVSGGAPLSKEVMEFFLSTGMVILEGYGLTETTSALTVNRPTNFRGGSVGLPFPRTEMKVAEDGELLVRGPQVFQGYHNNEEATREVLSDDRWLSTGDIGEIDRDGFIYITDRKKDIIVTAGGKNVAPQNIENALKATQYVSQALVYGDRRPYLTALITLDEVEMEAYAASHGLPKDMFELVDTAEVKSLVSAAVQHVNEEFGRVEQIKRFRVMPVDFTVEAGEITPTLKLKRKVVVERYQEWIDAMYETDAPDADSITDQRIKALQAPPVNA